ncbi:hypothetical protein [Acaryochloris sp. IP29b_bin.137]|uniref:hypothetical protein n=1 Tax=Acaryochloris sp. IP29b_bin.137 TaxID=2969217 RepID=UPI0026236E2A|nr:hypothetical protein [Acaryochloris sp. IP29b_bin.137]
MTTHPSTPSLPEPDRLIDTLQYERDQAQASATRWRRLYEVEAQQRQKEADIAEQTIQSLRAEIQHLCQFPGSAGTPNATTVRQSVGSSNSVPYLKGQIADLMAERDQLLQALEQEKHNHEKTRDNLISALDDALGAQRKQKSLALPSSKAGARASAIILKDRDGRKIRLDG